MSSGDIGSVPGRGEVPVPQEWLDEVAQVEAGLRQAADPLMNFGLILSDANGMRRTHGFGSESEREVSRDNLQGRSFRQLCEDIDGLLDSPEIEVSRDEIDALMTGGGMAQRDTSLWLSQRVFPVFKALVLDKGYAPQTLRSGGYR